MQETSTPKSTRPMLMGGRRLCCSYLSNSVLTFTGDMRKAQPAPWWAYRAFTRVTLSSTLASLLAWDSNHSVPGASNWVETQRWSRSTFVKCTTGWRLCATFVGHLPAWQCKTFETSSQCAKKSITKSTWSTKPMKCTERLRSPKTPKRNRSLTSQKSIQVAGKLEGHPAWTGRE